MIRVATTSDLSSQRNGFVTYFTQQYFSALGTVLPKSFTGAFSSNSRLDVREVYAKSVRAFSVTVVSIFLKTCVKDHADSSSRLVERSKERKRKKLWLNTYVIASAKEKDALNITMSSCINSTNVHLCNYCTKIFVIVVNTCLCRRSFDNKAAILS